MLGTQFSKSFLHPIDEFSFVFFRTGRAHQPTHALNLLLRRVLVRGLLLQF